MTHALEVINLTKGFKQGRGLLDIFKKRQITTALDGVNLEVKQGEIFALLGPNGAGKTTLIKVLASLILPDGGQAKVNGFDVVQESEKAKATIGLVVGEERSFYWRLTGRQNLEFFSALYNLSRKKAKERIEEITQFLEIEDLNKRYQEYSTGVKHRLAIARCLLADAQIIFMDEPTRSLDPLAASKLRAFIKEKLVSQLGKTVFFTTHQTYEAEVLAERIAIIDRGKIKASGTMTDLRAKAKQSDANLEEIFKVITQTSSG